MSTLCRRSSLREKRGGRGEMWWGVLTLSDITAGGPTVPPLIHGKQGYHVSPWVASGKRRMGWKLGTCEQPEREDMRGRGHPLKSTPPPTTLFRAGGLSPLSFP